MSPSFGRGRAERARSAADVEAELDRQRRARNWAVAWMLGAGPRRPSARWWRARRAEIARHDDRIAGLAAELASCRLAERRARMDVGVARAAVAP